MEEFHRVGWTVADRAGLVVCALDSRPPASLITRLRSLARAKY